MAIDEHEIFSLNVIIMVGLLGLSIFCAYLMKKFHFYNLPESAAAMLMGVIVGGVARGVTDEEERRKMMFQPEVFFFLLMPPIIFEAGYTLKRKRFFQNITSILLFAVLGTVVSTFVVGFMVYGFARAGVVTVATDSPLQSLLFGALISAVDPVATLSIMGSPELNCDKMLYSLVFGESVLNDAVAVVLFKTFASMTSKASADVNSFRGLVVIVLQFVGISLASVIVGVLIGLAASALFKHTQLRKYPHKEIVVLFMCAYCAYAIGEALYLSGIMALFFCGIILSHYNWYNLSDASKVASAHVFKGFAMTTETMVFLYLGMSLFSGIYSTWNFGFAVLAILSCLLARACNVVPISFLANLRRKRKITPKMQFAMWFAGLRGAIAFALSMNMPNVEGNKWDNDVIVTTTLIIVIFTTVFCGALTEPLLRKMELKHQTAVESDDEAAAVLRDATEEGLEAGLTGPTPVRQRHQASGLHKAWSRIDDQYMKPMFGGKRRRTRSEEGGMELSSLSEGKERSDSSGIDTRDLLPPDSKPSTGRSDAPYSPPAHAPSPAQPVTSSTALSQMRSPSPATVLSSVRSASPRQSAASVHAMPVTSDYVEVTLDGDIGEGSGSFFGGLRSPGGVS